MARFGLQWIGASRMFLVGAALLALAISGCDKDDADSNGSESAGNNSEGGGAPPLTRERPETCNTDCRTMYAGVGEHTRLAIEELHYGSRSVVQIRNLTGADLDMAGWTVCTSSGCAPLPEGAAVPERGRFTVNMVTGGPSQPTALYVGSPELAFLAADEFALYSTSTQAAGDIQAYVRWGDLGSPTHESAAGQADFWRVGTRVFVCDANTSFMAIGNVGEWFGFRNSPPNCFE